LYFLVLFVDVNMETKKKLLKNKGFMVFEQKKVTLFIKNSQKEGLNVFFLHFILFMIFSIRLDWEWYDGILFVTLCGGGMNQWVEILTILNWKRLAGFKHFIMEAYKLDKSKLPYSTSVSGETLLIRNTTSSC
jgi:hypothetical protein